MTNPAIHPSFTLERDEFIEENKAYARIYRHNTTGARLLSMECDDENKVFGISFRTPPEDSTGVAHILEHSVLCGSRKYPLKEPFVELLKGSLQTFLNAFTYPDKTCYPVASANLQDHRNLIDVYLDAVFHPRITENIFRQEGWHYELEDENGPMVYKGVVFNEMKGAYSSPDSVLSEKSQQCVFPDITYGLDSGGDPEVIPELTYEQFLNFHKTYYHPANSFIWFYGDDEPAERLEIIANALEEFGPLEVQSDVPMQERYAAPLEIEDVYAGGDEDDGKSMVTVNWLLDDVCDADRNFRLRVLEEILVGMASSPLRKALIESGLGEDTAGVGLEEELRQMYFSIGLKGLDPANTGKVQPIIMDCFEKLVADGISVDLAEAALNTIEFDFRENNTGRFPRGLGLMVRSLSTWLYDGDPLAMLRFEAPLKALRDDLEAGKQVFADLIRECFLENPHRITLTLNADPELGKQREQREKDKLAKAFEELGEQGRKNVVALTRELLEEQRTPDAPEALATIPMLKVDDLPRENQPIPGEMKDVAGTRLFTHDLNTNGIAYLDLGFDFSGLDMEDLPWISLFGRTLTEMGTTKEDYVSLTRRIATHTGGMGASEFITATKTPQVGAYRFMVRAKTTTAKSAEMCGILEDILTSTDFNDPKRFKEMLLEEKARMEQRIIPSGHAIVAGRLSAHFSKSGHVNEIMGGISYLDFLRDLVSRIDSDWDMVRGKLGSLRDRIITSGNLVSNLTATADGIETLTPQLEKLIANLPSAATPRQDWPAGEYPTIEGLTMPAQVNYVGKAVNLYEHGIKFNGSMLAIARYLRTAWLWDQIRVQGGAYGAFCMFNELTGVLALVSYRDPNLKRTLDIYDQTPDYLNNLDLHQDELSKAIIGSVGDIDTYKLPDSKGFTAYSRLLVGRTDEELQKLREEILATSADSFKEFAKATEILRDHGQIVVLGDAAEVEGAVLKKVL